MSTVPPFPPLRGSFPKIAIVRDLAIFNTPHGWKFTLPGGSDNLVYLKIELVADRDGSGINQGAARNQYPLNIENYSFGPFLGFIDWEGQILGDNAFDLLNVMTRTEIDSGPPTANIGYPLPSFVSPFNENKPYRDFLLNGIQAVFLMLPGDAYLWGNTFVFWAQQLYNPYQQSPQQQQGTVVSDTNIAGIPLTENR